MNEPPADHPDNFPADFTVQERETRALATSSRSSPEGMGSSRSESLLRVQTVSVGFRFQLDSAGKSRGTNFIGVTGSPRLLTPDPRRRHKSFDTDHLNVHSGAG